jgi:hypothetical protein
MVVIQNILNVILIEVSNLKLKQNYKCVLFWWKWWKSDLHNGCFFWKLSGHGKTETTQASLGNLVRENISESNWWFGLSDSLVISITEPQEIRRQFNYEQQLVI